MKYNLIILLISLLFAGSLRAGEGHKGTGEKDGYRLVWQDLFESDILNETEKWTVEINGDGSGNEELQYYRRENVSIENEPVSGKKCLVLTARKENYQGRKATSGRLTTQHKMTVQYGKVEARIKLPQIANGLWPAFWLLGANYPTVGWPRCGEIDIMEMGHINGIKNATQNRLFNGACHWGYFQDGWHPMHSQEEMSKYSLLDDFHLFTLMWDKQSIRMYLDLDVNPDVEPYFQLEITNDDDPRANGHYFNEPFFILFNLAVGGHFTGIIDIDQVTALADNKEAKMYIDFVKVYQRESDNGSICK